MLGIYVTYFILCLIAVFVISGSAEAWIRSHATDLDEGCEHPRAWCAWGRVRSVIYERDYGTYRYFFLKLPSYEWGPHWHSDLMGWRQRVLWWSTGRGWSLQSWPCDR